MKFQFSSIGNQLARGSGIEQLMDDLGHALHQGGPHVRMLGGGNPAAIPEVTALWRQEMQDLLANHPERFDRMLVNYDPCRGNPALRACSRPAGHDSPSRKWDRHQSSEQRRFQVEN